MTLTVYCGSRFGNDKIYEQRAHELGLKIAKRGHNLVFGGGSVGLMGIISKSAYKNGSVVTGIIPILLQEQEEASCDLSELIVVESMHERKALMENMADAFVAMPGGIGTMEEIFEVWTWSQLGYHNKPVVFLNINGYYDKLFDFLDSMTNSGFLNIKDRELIKIYSEVDDLLDFLESTV